jgi:hypothetical protein
VLDFAFVFEHGRRAATWYFNARDRYAHIPQQIEMIEQTKRSEQKGSSSHLHTLWPDINQRWRPL